MNFQEKPPNETQDTKRCVSLQVSYYRSTATKYLQFVEHAWRVRSMNFREIAAMEADIQQKICFVFEVNCP